MSAYLFMRGVVRQGHLHEFVRGVKALKEHRKSRAYCVPEVLYGLSGPMNTVLLRFAFPDLGKCLVLAALIASATRAEPIRLHGAASVVDSVIQPHKQEVERATGISLAIDRSNAGKGLKDLIEGKCDASLASASIEATVGAAKAAGLDRPVPADLRLHVVKTSEVVFVVHPSNTVKALTWEQIKDVHTGKITNWKEVGGKDQPIAVYTDAAASATRALVQQTVLSGAQYGPSAKAVGFVKEVNQEVARDPRGIGALGREFVEPGAVTVVETKKLERPLGFVTIGEPSPQMRKVIDGYRSVK